MNEHWLDDILGISKWKEPTLADLVEKKYHLPEGTFANVNNDLSEFINNDRSPMLKMAYAYARRSAAAGLFLQGVFTAQQYDYVSTIFKSFQMNTGHTVEFQEEAADQASDLLYSYDQRLDRRIVSFITSMVELRQQALDRFNGETTLISKMQYWLNHRPERSDGGTYFDYELVINTCLLTMNQCTPNNTDKVIKDLFRELHSLLKSREIKDKFYNHYTLNKDIILPEEINYIMDQLAFLTGKTHERIFRDFFMDK